jgi:alkaline phosphatase D
MATGYEGVVVGPRDALRTRPGAPDRAPTTPVPGAHPTSPGPTSPRPTTLHHRTFRCGVASGDPTATSIVLWSRVHDRDGAPMSVAWSIWTEDGRPVDRGQVWASRDTDHTCKVDVTGLSPGTGYHYVFEANGDRIVGRTRTLPVVADSFRFAVACCSRWGWPGFDGYAAILAESPDLVVHLGDYIYEIGETPPDGPITDPPHDCETLGDYRRRYRQHRGHPAVQRLHAAVPVLAVWDDHEVTDDAPGDPTGQRRAAGQRAWREWMPTRATRQAPRLDRHLRIERLLDLALVDARFGGRPAVDTSGPSTARPDTRLLTDAQWETVGAAVATDAPWCVIANQVQVAPLTLGWIPALRWPPWRRIVNPDQWDGFPAERRRLVERLAQVQGTPVLLSGDLHAGWARRLLDGDRTVAHEFTAPSISGTTFAEAVREQTGLPAWFVDWLIRRFNPGVDHVDLSRHGFLVVDVTCDELTVSFVHDDGTRVTRGLRSRG